MPQRHSPSDWQLPPGVTRGAWDYAQAPHIATDYDNYFADHAMLRLDRELVQRHLTKPGTVLDLGCGTGRALLPLIRDGHRGIGIDLSQHMLRTLQEKAHSDGLDVVCIRGNLVELDFLADAIVDYALCLFSTLGMIHRADHRLDVLRHVHRIVKPGGLLVLHVHNYWHNLWISGGRQWLIQNQLNSWLGRQSRGDRQYDYRGVRNFYLHVFTRRELKRLVQSAGWGIECWNPIASDSSRLLPASWRLNRLRAQGWILVCRRLSA